MNFRPALLTLVLMFGHATSAQRPIISVTNGATNPLQISDTVAYRLYFLSLAKPDSGDVATAEKVQLAEIAPLGLTDADREAVIAAAEDFKAQDSRLREGYNASVFAEGESLARANTLRNERDDLVQLVRSSLASSLSLEGLATLEDAVQASKHNIQIQTSQPAVVAPPTATHTVAAAIPNVQIGPCGNSEIVTWTTSIAQSETYSISDPTTFNSTVVVDGSASASVRWPPDCIPGSVKPYYTPAVNNTLSSTQGTPTPGPAYASGQQFTYSSFSTRGEVLPLSIITGNFGYDVEGDGTDGDVIYVVPQLIYWFEFEIATTRESNLGTRSGKVYLPATGTTLWNYDSQYWCTAATSPPDQHQTPTQWAVSTGGIPGTPVPVPSFWDTSAACVRASGAPVGTPWACSHGIAVPLSSPQPLYDCTKADQTSVK